MKSRKSNCSNAKTRIMVIALVWNRTCIRMGVATRQSLEPNMLHLVISCSSYLLFFLVKTLMPTQQASWRITEKSARDRFLHP